MVKHEKDVNNQQNAPVYRYVLNIHRMTTHNGPGIRTLFQFKGCPLRCAWCSAPESQKSEPEIAVYPAKCIQCNRCTAACHLNAIKLDNEDISIDRLLCDRCGKCAEVCHSEAIKLLGRAMTVEELVEEAKRDSVFFKHSGGGVTLSGGEPLLKPHFTGKLLRALKGEGISVGADTCGYVPWEELEPMLPFIDFFLWDIKHMNPDIHKTLTEVSNERILNNIRLAAQRNIPIYIRIPVITGYNDSAENIGAVIEFVRRLPSLKEVDLIPLHHLGKARYDSLNRPYPIPDTLFTAESTVHMIKKLIDLNGLKCTIVT